MEKLQPNLREGRLNSQMYEIDTSELRGRYFRCIEGCGFCCLCQPELMREEVSAFRGTPIELFIVNSPIQRGRKALKMRSNGGACSMLRNRKCTIYEKRPHFCRQFPVRTHLMNRIQLTADLSCRGVWLKDGEDLESYGLNELHRLPEQYVQREFEEARYVFEEFRQNALEEGVWFETDILRRDAQYLIENSYFDSIPGMGRVIRAAEISRERGIGFMEAIRTVGAQEGRRAALDMMRELLGELTEEKPLNEYPVFVDKDLNWKIYTMHDGMIEEKILKETGGTIGGTDFRFDTEAIEIEDDGIATMREYASLLNRRDAFLGFVYYLTDDAEYEYSMYETYMENIAVLMLDLAMRSALVQRGKVQKLSSEHIEEGIVFLDMDVHDAPTIGAVI